MLTLKQLEQLLTLAGDAALQAGQYITGFDRNAIEVNIKADCYSKASQVVTQVDLECERLIFDMLKPSCNLFDIAFLGEESSGECSLAQHPRLSQPYFWCVDPLDGTLPFTENVHGYAVSIALLTQSGEPILGVVYDPVTKTLYQGLNESSQLNNKSQLLKQKSLWRLDMVSPEKKQGQVLNLYFDRSFITQPIFIGVIELMQYRSIQLGYSGIKVSHQFGAVMNAMQVIEKAHSCYFKFPKVTPGGGSLWDFAATSAIAHAAGAWVSDIHGRPLQLNSSESLFMNKQGILFASNNDIANEVIQLFKRLNN